MNGIEKAIRESGQHPGHKCPVCGGHMDSDVAFNKEMRLLVVCGVPVQVPPYLLDTLQELYNNYARPVNRAVLGLAPDMVSVHLHHLRRLLFHTKAAILDVDGKKDAIELKISERKSA